MSSHCHGSHVTQEEYHEDTKNAKAQAGAQRCGGAVGAGLTLDVRLGGAGAHLPEVAPHTGASSARTWWNEQAEGGCVAQARWTHEHGTESAEAAGHAQRSLVTPSALWPRLHPTGPSAPRPRPAVLSHAHTRPRPVLSGHAHSRPLPMPRTRPALWSRRRRALGRGDLRTEPGPAHGWRTAGFLWLVENWERERNPGAPRRRQGVT